MSGQVSSPHDGSETQRLDKWLWFARLVKTRTLATRLVSGGKVRVNRQKTDKAAQPIRCGDVITARIGRRVRVLRITALGTRRGPAREAQHLYEDLSPDLSSTGRGHAGTGRPGEGEGDRAEPSPAPPGAIREPGSGRPTKRDRRRLERLRSSDT